MKRRLAPPVFPGDADKTIAAAMVHYGIIFGALSVILYAPSLLIAGDPGWRILAVEGTLLGGLALHHLVLRRGEVRRAAVAFALFGWLALAYVNYTAGGVRAPGFSTHVLFILSVGSMFGGRGVFLAATASTLLGVLFLGLERRGLLPPSQVSNTSLRYWFIFSSNLFVAAAILTMLVRRLHATIAEGRRELAERQEAERRLERVQEGLEDAVRERTAELKRSNDLLLREVADRRRAEDALRLERDLIATIMEASPVGILTIDAGCRFTFANAAAERVLRLGREEILRRSCTAAAWRFCDLHGRPVAPEQLPFSRAAAGGEAVLNTPLAFETPAGGRVQLSVNVVPLRESAGRPGGLVATVEDVTELRRMEEELFRAQKLDSVGVLAGGLAHDFNNLLTAVVGNLSLARLDLPPGRRAAAAALDAAEDAALRSRDLTQQLLTFSRGGAPVKEPVAVGELAIRAARLSLSGSNVRAVDRFPPGLWTVDADPGQLAQVFHNLAINAGQAMPEGGTVELEAANVTLGEGSGLPLPPGRYVRVTVADSGSGIPPEHLEKVFDPYFTTKERGTGLGLAIVHSILQRHGGHVGAASAPGKGATFTLHLPAGAAAPAPPPGAGAARAASGSGRILLMDDEPAVRDVGARMLAAFGYEALTVTDGAAAVAAFREGRARGEPFDAVILDLTIPAGMGGKDAIRELLAIDPGVRAVVSSGYSSDPVMASYREHGFSGVLVKPYQAADLTRVLGEVLRAD